MRGSDGTRKNTLPRWVAEGETMIRKSKKHRDVKPGDTFTEKSVAVPDALEHRLARIALEVVSDNAKDNWGDRLWIASVAVTVKASIGVIESSGEYALAGGEEKE